MGTLPVLKHLLGRFASILKLFLCDEKDHTYFVTGEQLFNDMQITSSHH